ncbi:MAG: 50S ribosomal protein L23 [Candidatus Wildermuthbacteria bacterium]|nr:50S ribosomal protein L23 [Candidatus Wildermuthbacteria bacterium]
MRVLQVPLIKARGTEKASVLGKHRQYVFEVRDGATKGSVKFAVEKSFGVVVTGIQMIQKRAKKIRVGRRVGVRPGTKKAVVRLKEGQSIELGI